MKNILKNISLFCLAGIILSVGCTDQNYLHDKYLKEGEILYVSMFDSIKALSGLGRLELYYWLSDPQVQHVEISWDNGQKSKREAVSLTRPESPGVIKLTGLSEGNTSFELRNYSAGYEDKSVATRFTRYIYGEKYIEILNNRFVKDYAFTLSADSIKINWIAAVYDGTSGTAIRYWTNGGLKTDTIAKAKDLVETINETGTGFNPPKFKNITRLANVLEGSYFSFKVMYLPVNACDALSTPWDSILLKPVVRVSDVKLNINATAVNIGTPKTLAAIVYPEDAQNKALLWMSTRPNVAAVDINGRVTGLSEGYTYINVASVDGNYQASCLVRVNAAGYVDLDRSKWFAEPERDADTGTPLTTVNHYHTSAPAVTTAAKPVTVEGKIKSPYLSHFLPWASAGLPGSGDALNSPGALFDNQSGTYLAMVKGTGTQALQNATGIGTTAETHAHSYQGVGLWLAGEKPWFIIRLDENTPQRFNYFRIRYRENGGSSALKPHGLSFYGSNDDNCITSVYSWEPIAGGSVILLNERESASDNWNTVANNNMFNPGTGLETGNQMFTQTYEYKYIKVQYEQWTLASNTVSIAEFYLGLRQ